MSSDTRTGSIPVAGSTDKSLEISFSDFQGLLFFLLPDDSLSAEQRMCLGTFSRLRRSLATSTLYVAVRIPAERFLLYRKAISCKVKKNPIQAPETPETFMGRINQIRGTTHVRTRYAFHFFCALPSPHLNRFNAASASAYLIPPDPNTPEHV